MDELTLEQKIAICDIEVQDFITALKQENRKLQKKIAKCQAELVTAKTRIEELEPFEQRCHELDSLSEEELEERERQLSVFAYPYTAVIFPIYASL